MPFNIDTYKASIAKQGILRNNRFDVIVNPPDILSGSTIVTAAGGSSSGDISRLLKFRAEQFKAPGISLDTKPINRYGMGTYQKMPYSASYTDNSITFLSDGYGNMWNFWYQWIDSIFNFAGNDQAPGSVIGGFNTLPSYQLEYKDRYATTISVIIYNEAGQQVQKINMYDAFPISINDVDLNWGMKNQPLKVTVGISFKEFTIEKSTVSNNYNPSSKMLGTLGTRNPNLNPMAISPNGISAPEFLQQQGVTAGVANPPIRNPQ